MKFIHLGDCHLGGWKHPSLKELNFKSFQYAINFSIKEKVNFVLISGDLFDSPYPPIETLKETFQEFKRLNDEKIPVFLIAGSHDYSVSGKTFLDVLEKSGFCKNVSIFEEVNNKIYLLPTILNNVAIYGYPGKKGGLEVDDIERIVLQDSPGLFKILLLHTAIRDAVGFLPIKAVDQEKLPNVDYLGLSHLHINYHKKNRVYSGPIFPNNLLELEELKGGSFYFFDSGKVKRIEIKLKDVLVFSYEIKDAYLCAEEIILSLKKENINDKILIIKIFGALEKGKVSDIDFQKIEIFAKENGAHVLLKSTSKLYLPNQEIKIDITDSINMEEQIIKKFGEQHSNKLNIFLPELFKTFQLEKSEDEKSSVFEDRIFSEIKKILSI